MEVCGCRQDWSAASFIETTVAQLKEQLGDDKVVLGLSGGVDSSVAAVLLNRAIGKNLTCILWIMACCAKMNLKMYCTIMNVLV